jgi:hypothetical protein
VANRYRRYGRAPKNARTKRRDTEYFDEAHLQLRRGIWHAVMPIPRDVQEAVGQSSTRKTRFGASLKTRSIEEARMRLPAYISLWKAQIAQARRASSKRAAATAWGTAVPRA